MDESRDGWVPFTAEAVREIRLELDYTIEEAASLGAFSSSRIVAVEQGHRPPSVSSLQALALAYALTFQIDRHGVWIRRDPLDD